MGHSKVFPTRLQSFVIPISQLGEIYDDLNSLQFTFSLWSKKFFYKHLMDQGVRGQIFIIYVQFTLAWELYE